MNSPWDTLTSLDGVARIEVADAQSWALMDA
jgi:hypothetical protein